MFSFRSLLLSSINQEEFRVVCTREERKTKPERRFSLLWRLYGRARLEREERQPQVAHFDEDAVERCLVLDGTGKQVVPSLWCVIERLSNHACQKVSRCPLTRMTYIIRLCSVRMTFSHLRRRIHSGQGEHSHQKDTFERREEQPEEDQMVAKRIPCLWTGSHRSFQCRPRGDAEASLEQRERACTCNGLRPILCSEFAENTGDMFLGRGERDH